MSPIKDLTDAVRLPRLGKIHLGIRHPEKGYPMKTDYFVFPKDHADYKKLVELFGEKPKELRILIPVEDEEQWASQYYKAYNQTYGLVCKGDGELALRMVALKTGNQPDKDTPGTVTLREQSCPGKDCHEYKSKKCGEVMNLRFLLPEVPGLGVWQIDTGSINSILNINSCAWIIKRAFGRISLIPLKLTFEPMQVNNPDDGKKQTVYVLNLRTSVTMAQLADAAREQAKTFLLEAPDFEAVIEQEVDALYSENQGTNGIAKAPKKAGIPPLPDDLNIFSETPEQEAERDAEEKRQDEVAASQSPTAQPSAPSNLGINMIELAENLKICQWSPTDTIKWLSGERKIKGLKVPKTVDGIVAQLTAEQRLDLFIHVKERAELSGASR